MKSTEVYRVLRDLLAPWCKDNGFARTQGGMLGWYAPRDTRFLSFWCQCSQDGWDDHAGSKLVVEFQLSEQPRPGTGHVRCRLATLLEESELERVRTIQNEVITKLPRPPETHWILARPELSGWYRAKFEQVTKPYVNTDDVWLQYHDAEDVRKWARFVAAVLPAALQRFERWDSEVRLAR